MNVGRVNPALNPQTQQLVHKSKVYQHFTAIATLQGLRARPNQLASLLLTSGSERLGTSGGADCSANHGVNTSPRDTHLHQT